MQVLQILVVNQKLADGLILMKQVMAIIFIGLGSILFQLNGQ
jgi:hypothetical protein